MTSTVPIQKYIIDAGKELLKNCPVYLDIYESQMGDLA